jgi:hypothetical protein
MSKAKRLLRYLRDNNNKAFFSRELVDALSCYGVKAGET